MRIMTALYRSYSGPLLAAAKDKAVNQRPGDEFD
jgi:hypothetical protein